MIIGMMGILKAGRTYLPIDLTTMNEVNICYKIVKQNIYLVSEQRKYCRNLRVKYCILIKISFQGEESNLVEHNPNDLAYVIYTSGSTGNPKG